MGPQLIDLSQEIYQGMPVFPPHQPTMIFPNISHEDSLKQMGFMFATNNLLLSEHGPTHTDAPYEYDPQGSTIDHVELSRFFGPAYGIDVSNVSPDDYITRRDIENALDRHGFTLNRGDIVMIHTGHYQRAYGTPEWLTRYTGLNKEAADFLTNAGVGMIGVDSPSIDKTDDKQFCGHTACQRSGMLNTENLCNLDKVIGKRFLYVGFPLKIRRGTGSPVRAVAVLT